MGTRSGSLRGKSKASNVGANDPMDNYIDNFSANSPRSQHDVLLDYMTNTFKQKNFNPARIFSMADHDRTKSARLSDLMTAFQKIFPQFKTDFLSRIP